MAAALGRGDTQSRGLNVGLVQQEWSAKLLASLVASKHTIQQASRLLWLQSDAYTLRCVAIALILVVGMASLAALAPVALQLVIDWLTSEAQESGELLLLLAAYVVSHWVARTLGELRWYAYGRVEQRIQRGLSKRIFTHIMSLPMQFHLERRTGALSQTVSNGLLGCRMVLQHTVFSVFPVLLELIAMATVLIHFGHIPFLIILTGSAVAYAVAFSHGVAQVSQPARAVSASHIDATAMMTDAIINYETVKYFGAEKYVADRYDQVLSRVESHWTQFYKNRTINGLIVSAIFTLSLGATIGLATSNVIQGTMTIGELVLINTYILQIVRPLEMLGIAFRDIAQGSAFLEKMLELFQQAGEVPTTGGTTSHLMKNEGALVFDRVSFAYHPGKPVLRDVSLVVPPGKTVAIVGPSGSGKSTLIRLLTRLYDLDSGAILMDGVPITEMAPSTVRHAISVVPQDSVLFNETLRFNIEFGRPGASQSEIERAAHAAHIDGLIAELPDGYATVVGERGLKLSGGEKQRVAIARAALRQPLIHVFDEATSSLDSDTEREIMKNLIELSCGTTTMVIAHRLSTVVHAHEIVVICQGEIVERGTHSKLLSLQGVYASMWQSQHPRKTTKTSDTAA